MDKEREAFEKWANENIAKGRMMNWQEWCWEAWLAAKTQAVQEKPHQFNLHEFLLMEQKLKSKGGIIKADLDRFIAYAEMVLEKAKANRSQNDH